MIGNKDYFCIVVKRLFLILTFAFASALALSAEGGLSVKYPYSDNMVLQQDTLATIAGHAIVGNKVRIVTSWDKKTYSAVTDSAGVWRVKVRTPKASFTNYTIDIKSGKDRLTIKDVLIGEVWIASGQSNMEMQIKGFFNCPVKDAYDVITSPAGKDRLRMFRVRTYQSKVPLDDVAKTDGWLKPDPNTVRLMCAVAYFFAEKLGSMLDVPVGILAFPRGGSKVESWLPRETVESYADIDCSEDAVKKLRTWHHPFEMYNGMQHPVRGYTARGFIWYQGCSNVTNYEFYAERLLEMVRQWREDWGDTTASMPFYQVEIAPFKEKVREDGFNYPLLRQAQHKSAAIIPNGSIISTDDLVEDYEATNIHPANKKPVGHRLANLALNRDYGYDNIACYCPEVVRAFRSKEVPSKVCLEVKFCKMGIDRRHEVKGLEVAGEDGVFVPVEDISMNEKRKMIEFSVQSVPQPRYVRYCWGDFCPGNLHNCEGLPFVPFNLSVE